MFGIRIATYRRPTGTYHLLYRCLRRILNQTYQNWKIFLIGDCYEPNEEFCELASMIPNNKLYKYNLKFSPERTKYSGLDLWKVAGCTACQLGLSMIRQEGLIHVPVDDDDELMPEHLATLASGYRDFPEAVFIYTQSTYKGGVLPVEKPDLYYNNREPRACQLIHSATSWDTKRLPLMYKNIIDEPSPHVAGDAEMWDRVRDYCHERGLKSLYIPKLTVRHDYEQCDQPVIPLLL